MTIANHEQIRADLACRPQRGRARLDPRRTRRRRLRRDPANQPPFAGAVGVAGYAHRTLRAVARGRLAAPPVAIRFWDGSTIPASDGDSHAPAVLVRDPRALSHLLYEPNEIGLTRAWVQQSLDLDGDLEQVVTLRDRFRDLRLTALERARLALAAIRIAGVDVLRPPEVPAIEARPRGRRHSVARDRDSVRHHYELSNRFYRLLLGPSMVYSCAYFEHPEDSLEEAQERKLETICRKLRLAPGERLLDIGCGWGSLLLHAAARHGVRGVGVTLSDAQAALARERLARAGVGDRVEIRVCDYREVQDGPYDKVASVGMYEHVGRAQLERYVRHVQGLLRAGGLFLNHGIARLWQRPRANDTFINRYVFPDGELHPVTDVMSAMQSSGLEIRDLESLREHYVLTLRRWIANLDAAGQEATREVGEARTRVWRLYLLGSAHAFETGQISVFQVLGACAGAPHRLPLSRRALVA
jgi:cyclopropane-fatty-acyl-phospholipid synthase